MKPAPYRILFLYICLNACPVAGRPTTRASKQRRRPVPMVPLAARSPRTPIRAGTQRPENRPASGADTLPRRGYGAASARNGRKNSRRSSTSTSGCSRAAKWPPRSASVQWTTLYDASAQRRGVMNSS